MTCQYCGKKFSVYHCDLHRQGGPAKFCSSECYHKSTRTPPVIRKCMECGKEFEANKSHKDRKYCSVQCACLHRRKSPSNVTVGKDGYKYVWMSDGSGVKEHRFVMEKHLGRPLRKDEHVHHKDFNRQNNDISNLVILTPSEHSRLHRLHEIEIGKGLFGRPDEQQTEREKRRA